MMYACLCIHTNRHKVSIPKVNQNKVMVKLCALNSRMSTCVVGQNISELVIMWLPVSYGQRQSKALFIETLCKNMKFTRTTC